MCVFQNMSFHIFTQHVLYGFLHSVVMLLLEYGEHFTACLWTVKSGTLKSHLFQDCITRMPQMCFQCGLDRQKTVMFVSCNDKETTSCLSHVTEGTADWSFVSWGARHFMEQNLVLCLKCSTAKRHNIRKIMRNRWKVVCRVATPTSLVCERALP
jgi:hypothetical protein